MATRLFNVALAASATAAAMGAAYATRGPLAAASVAGWFALHVTIAKMYESACGSRTIADYPGWSWLASLWHGLLAMPILVSATVLLLPTTTAGVDGFLREGWERMPWPLEHVHYAIFGYMLKDFVLYPAGIELGYLVHHLITIAGCTLCLHLPAGAALTTLNGAQVCRSALRRRCPHTAGVTRSPLAPSSWLNAAALPAARRR